MLQAIREKAQGWIAWAIVIMISIPFALWGIQSYLGVGSEPVVAEVNGAEIMERDLAQRMRTAREQLRLRLGNQYRAEDFSEELLREQVRSGLIGEILLDQAAQDWGMRAGDAMVREYVANMPAFQQSGQFSMSAYSSALRNQGLSEGQFEQMVRQDLVQGQLMEGIQSSAFATKRELAEVDRLRGQQRDVAFLRVPAADFLTQVETDEAALKAYYDGHLEAYKVPERVKVEYVMLDLADLAADVAVSEATLQDYYSQHRDEFQVPEERRVRHILFAVPETADDAAVEAARQRAEAARARLSEGGDFAELAKELSEDPGSAGEGGDLGWIQHGMMAAAFEESAFGLEPKLVSEPVRTPFGFHLIEVTELREGEAGGLDSVRDQVETAYRKSQAETRFYEEAERLAQISYEAPDSLQPVAEELGLKVRETDWFDREHPDENVSSPKVLAAAFSDDVLIQGNNSEVVELDKERVLVLRIAAHEAERARSFEEVRGQVEDAYRLQRARQLAEQAGKDAIAAIEAGSNTLEGFSSTKGWSLTVAGWVGRGGSGLPPEVAQSAFELTRPAERSITGVALNNGDYAVVRLTGVRDGEATAEDPERSKLEAAQLARIRGTSDFERLTQDLRDRAKIVLH